MYVIMYQGDAAIYILRSAFGVNWSQDIRIIFAGDDLTDEDAMKALKVNLNCHVQVHFPSPKSQVLFLSSLVQVLKDPTQSRNFHDLP